MSAQTLLAFLTQALYIVVFLLVTVTAVRRPRRASLDTALLFGVASGLVAEEWILRILHAAVSPALATLSTVLLLALPYLLLRLVHDVAGVARAALRGAEAALAAATLGVIVWAGRPLPGWLILLYIAYFVGFTFYGSVLVVRAASRSRGVTRRRLQAVAGGSLCLGLTILLASTTWVVPAWATGETLLVNLTALGSGLGYFIGFAPPLWLRQAWQGPELRAFLGRTAHLSRLSDTLAIVQEIERGAAVSLGAPAAWIGLWDETAGVLRGAIAGTASEVRPGEAIGGQVFAAQRPLFWADAAQADPPRAERYRARGATAVLGAPITAGAIHLGVLVVYAPQAPLFVEDDLVLLQVLADQAAVMLENRVLIDEMARATRVKSEFLANMSHELRTPLNAIIGFSEVLQDGTFGPLNDRQQRYVGNVVESGHHLLGLVNDVLDLAKVEAGRMELHQEDVDLAMVLAEVQQTMQPLALSKDVDLRIETLDTGPVLYADRTRVVQILYNLLSNALKFTPAGGTVGMTWTAQPQSVAIAVTDTGIGIAREDQERIFEEFQQVHQAAAGAQQQQGTGLGLALTRRLIALHGGTIAVESVLGQGSTFTITLPTLPRQDALPVAAPATTERRGAVLVVEDQAAARELLRLYLTEAGYGVQEVSGAGEVLARARTLRPVAITLDLMLGNEVAWTVLEQLKADPVTRDIPVVIVSILDEQPTGFALGAAAYLVKPVARQDLLAALQRVVRADGQPLHVLAVDDQPEALELIALALEGGDHVLTPASSGDEALRLLALQRPDVLIVDLMMAPMSGFDLVAAVAADVQLRDLPIIVLTGRELTVEDLARLQGHILTTLPKRGFAKDRFLREVRRATGPSANESSGPPHDAYPCHRPVPVGEESYARR